MQNTKEISGRKRNLTLIAFSLGITLLLFAAFAWWQMRSAQHTLENSIKDQFVGFVKQGEAAEIRIDYDRATLAYENALTLAQKHPGILKTANTELVQLSMLSAKTKKRIGVALPPIDRRWRPAKEKGKRGFD